MHLCFLLHYLNISLYRHDMNHLFHKSQMRVKLDSVDLFLCLEIMYLHLNYAQHLGIRQN